ncbi:hypothetical protein DSM104443_03019 [Usitatibacter rugosus]|uniref:DNA-binding beta-propeller fold protein YncE n=1 Tax=Usitatibacter rugosus TaxID=2732067 RepID=A0A6M4GXE9_9PROT|nr:hypothetical protein [Usitatibacter rugosus]QJR11936.1 hypothetical protein DSM104443_03019 [Usitatibacter rugosus]
MDRRSARLATLFTVLTLALPAAAALRESETIAVGAGVNNAAVDKTTGRLFTANVGPARNDAGSISVLGLDGLVTVLPSAGTPGDLAVSSALRSVVVTHPTADRVSLIDADTLSMRIVTTGQQPFAVAVIDSKNRAYVVGRNRVATTTFVPGQMSGNVTEVDLSTGATRVFAMPDMDPTSILAVGDRVFVMVKLYGFAQELPAYVRELDTASGTFGPAVSVGRRGMQMLGSASGDELYVLGHADFMRDAPSVRAALFVLDTATLAIKRTILLPDYTPVTYMADGTRVYNLPNIMGALTLDPLTGNVYALDMFNKRFSIVNPATGALTAVELEFSTRSIAFEPVSRNLYVGFSYGGYAAVYSAGGDRLDTIALGETFQPGSLVALSIAVNPLSGAAYAINTGPGTVSILRAPESLVSQAFNATDLWWNANESGWGIYLEQQGTTMFGALFLRDEAGAPRWYTMSEGKRAGNGSFSGTLYRMQGLAGAGVRATAVGTLTFAPDSNDSASLSYTIGDAKRSTAITRTRFVSDRNCGWSNSAASKATHLPNYTALYYQPENSGWGLAVSHRGDTAFGVIFGYDAQQQPTWTLMSDGKSQAKGSGSAFGGTLYRVAGNSVAEIGSMSLAFGAEGSASLSYTADGKSANQLLQRHVFGAITSECGL